MICIPLPPTTPTCPAILPLNHQPIYLPSCPASQTNIHSASSPSTNHPSTHLPSCPVSQPDAHQASNPSTNQTSCPTPLPSHPHILPTLQSTEEPLQSVAWVSLLQHYHSCNTNGLMWTWTGNYSEMRCSHNSKNRMERLLKCLYQIKLFDNF